MSKIKVKGDGNHVYHKVKKSRINSNNQTTNYYSTIKLQTIILLLNGLLSLL